MSSVFGVRHQTSGRRFITVCLLRGTTVEPAWSSRVTHSAPLRELIGAGARLTQSLDGGKNRHGSPQAFAHGAISGSVLYLTAPWPLPCSGAFLQLHYAQPRRRWPTGFRSRTSSLTITSPMALPLACNRGTHHKPDVSRHLLYLKSEGTLANQNFASAPIPKSDAELKDRRALHNRPKLNKKKQQTKQGQPAPIPAKPPFPWKQRQQQRTGQTLVGAPDESVRIQAAEIHPRVRRAAHVVHCHLRQFCSDVELFDAPLVIIWMGTDHLRATAEGS